MKWSTSKKIHQMLIDSFYNEVSENERIKISNFIFKNLVDDKEG